MTKIGIILIIFAGVITAFFGEEGFVEIKKGESADKIYIEDDLTKDLGFSIKLEDINIEYYPEKRVINPALSTAKNSPEARKGGVKGYKTKVVINGRKGLIEVNKPFSYKGYSIYQYGYDESMPDQTLLQVVKDYGFFLACIGYGLLLLGIIVSYPSAFKVSRIHLFGIALLWLVFASLFFIRIRFPMVPALRSRWLVSHVSSVFIAYANFTFAFILSIIGFFRKKKDALLSLTHNSICLGFVFLTIGIIIGSIWARYAWGHWWGWDPKETWALITWVIYGIYFMKKEKWRLSPILFGIAGFLVLLFNYLGVTYLMKGLHSYG